MSGNRSRFLVRLTFALFVRSMISAVQRLLVVVAFTLSLPLELNVGFPRLIRSARTPNFSIPVRFLHGIFTTFLSRDYRRQNVMEMACLF